MNRSHFYSLCAFLLQTLENSLEEGQKLVEGAVQTSQMVLPGTSLAGRDIIREEVHALKQALDELTFDISSLKVHFPFSCVNAFIR